MIGKLQTLSMQNSDKLNLKKLQKAFALIESVDIRPSAIYMSKATFEALKKLGGSEEGCLVIWNRQKIDTDKN